ncbi:RhuM family protein [Alterisphingorhabdus coralli]|uniref:RhuM family protein n=1 Tax=Alterisphingorhabdus coralli TaxID=3071408 RepID=A0AA97F9D4_9SPHN|nr:RhuM family protein [Parasphingorhabdus sp. SCSIO 66989]WOE75447.1 RhuM family protein [Parasphingorhabdus sp. SCSIO 66989]
MVSSNEPVHLTEEENGIPVLIYGDDEGAKVELRYTSDALWMTQAQIAELYGRDVSVISRHINNILDEGELDSSNLQKMQSASSTKPTAIYSLDMVISVGYRVSSKQATIFRKWATDKLVQFASKGFVIDTPRLKNPENYDRIKELREIVRDIRSDEANLYRELKNICAMCQDYEPGSSKWTEFYRRTQAKLVYAVSSSTPSEIIKNRANARSENLGLTNWPKANIRKSDVTVSKNYLGKTEINELNRLTSILLDIFEDQLDLGRLTTMSQAAILLDKQLKDLGRSILQSGGTVRKADADRHAKREYVLWREEQKAALADQVVSNIDDLRKQAKRLRKEKK